MKEIGGQLTKRRRGEPIGDELELIRLRRAGSSNDRMVRLWLQEQIVAALLIVRKKVHDLQVVDLKTPSLNRPTTELIKITIDYILTTSGPGDFNHHRGLPVLSTYNKKLKKL